MLIGMNWIQKTDLTIKEEKIDLNVMKNEILKWLENLKKVFETILEGKLLLSRERMNYKITLRTEKIKSSLLILIRPEKQQIVKEYLNDIIKKEWIRSSKSSLVASLFLIPKSGTDKKRFVINYKKLNEETVTDSTSLLLIGDMMDQMKK